MPAKPPPATASLEEVRVFEAVALAVGKLLIAFAWGVAFGCGVGLSCKALGIL